MITVGTYTAAMRIASESEILPLIKKASYCIGTAYQQMDDKKELALGYFIRGGHTNKIIELVVNNVTIRFEGLFSEGIKVRPYLDQVANYFRKNHDFQSLYILGKACDQRCLQDEAESALSRFQLATSLGDYKEEPKGLADHKIPRIDMQISKSQEK